VAIARLDELLPGVTARRGHFAYESGLHGDVWLDLETLCHRPADLQPVVHQLAARVAPYEPDLICGPLIEGALIGLLVAADLRCNFTYAIRFAPAAPDRLFALQYRLPESQHLLARGKRVAIVNDVISAGSAVKGALANLRWLGADVVCVASMLVMGAVFLDFAATEKLPVETLAKAPSNCGGRKNARRVRPERRSRAWLRID
jgi:orotate phosphoribosyltransferase